MGMSEGLFEATLAKARAVVDKAKAEDRDLTRDEKRRVDGFIDRAEGLKRDATLERKLDEMMGGGPNARPVQGVKLSALVAEVVPSFGAKGLTDTPSLYVPSTFIATPAGSKGRAGDGALWSAFPSRTVQGGSVSYLQSTMGATTGAAEVAPGAQKPTADWTLVKVETALATFAVLSPYFADTLLADSAEMASFLDAELSALVRIALDKHVEAVIDAGLTLPVAFATSPLATIRKGATAVQGAGFSPSAVFVNPAEAESLDLTVGTDGQYVLDVRVKDSTPVWSLDVVVSRAMEVGKAFVLDPAAAGTTFLRSEARIALDALSRFDFDEVRARAEARGLFALHRPFAVAECDLTA